MGQGAHLRVTRWAESRERRRERATATSKATTGPPSNVSGASSLQGRGKAVLAIRLTPFGANIAGLKNGSAKPLSKARRHGRQRPSRTACTVP